MKPLNTQPSGRPPETVRLWVNLVGIASVVLGVIGLYIAFSKPVSNTKGGKSSPFSNARQMRLHDAPDYVGGQMQFRGDDVRSTDLPEVTKQQLADLGFGNPDQGNPVSVGIATNTRAARRDQKK